ncbi:MAG: hypothetical protein JW881_01880 [Spirochaetales bacterium]|nr:hypothetical protein [Spirochaetales bacterium]
MTLLAKSVLFVAVWTGLVCIMGCEMTIDKPAGEADPPEEIPTLPPSPDRSPESTVELQPPTPQSTPEFTEAATSVPSPPPSPEPTPDPTAEPAATPTSVPTPVPTAAPSTAPTPTPIHYAIIYYVSDTDCSDDQYRQGLEKVRKALGEIKEQFNVEFDLVNLGKTWDAPESDDTGTVLKDLSSDYSSYRNTNEYVVGFTPVMGNNGVAYLNGHHCVVAWKPSGLLSWDHEETKLTTHELTHTWGVAAEGHVDSLLPSTEVCIMNYWHLAFMDENNIVWCDGCRTIVEHTMNSWPAR